jgi:hypothetical protein
MNLKRVIGALLTVLGVLFFNTGKGLGRTITDQTK